MIYPKIPRKSLALLVISLIFTLAAAGIMFIIYFFNTNNTLFVKPLIKKIYNDGYHHHQQQDQEPLPSSYHHQQQQVPLQHQRQQQHHQTFSQDYNKDLESTIYQPYSEHDSRRNNRYSKKDKTSYRNGFLQAPDEFNDENYSGNRNNNYYTNADTIYIDDYDRVNEKLDTNNNGGEDKLDINGIDYFEAIIMDHDHKKDTKSRSEKLKATPVSLNGKEKDLMIFTKNLNNRRNLINKMREKKQRNGKNRNSSPSSEEEAFDNETIGSGSGDFIDDTESDDEQSSKLNKQRLKANRRSSNKRQKYRNFRFEAQNENLYSVSSEIVSNLSNESTLKPASTGFGSDHLATALVTTTSSLSVLPIMTSSVHPSSSLTSSEIRNNRINKLDKTQAAATSNKKWIPPSIVSSREVVTVTNQSPEVRDEHQNGAWLETRARRIMGNVKKSEERSRQLLLCEEAGGGELCRMLFKGHLNE